MAHWGWYWGIKKKHIAKRLCSNLRSIDSFKIQKPNMTMIFYVLENGINLATAVEHKDHFQVNIGKQAHTAYKIPIDKVPCYYGGFKQDFR